MNENNHEKELIEKVLKKQKAIPDDLKEEIEEAFEELKEKSDKKKSY